MSRYGEWSGEAWYLRSDHAPPLHSIQVIESVPKAPKKAKHRKKPKKVAFGFAREIPKKKRKR